MTRMGISPRLYVTVTDEVLVSLDKLSLRYPLIQRSRLATEALRLGVRALEYAPSGIFLPVAAGF